MGRIANSVNVRQLRTGFGLNVDQFAKKVGLSERTINRMEAGQSVALSSLRRVAQYCKIKVADILSEADPGIAKANTRRWREEQREVRRRNRIRLSLILLELSFSSRLLQHTDSHSLSKTADELITNASRALVNKIDAALKLLISPINWQAVEMALNDAVDLYQFLTGRIRNKSRFILKNRKALRIVLRRAKRILERNLRPYNEDESAESAE